MRLLAAAIYGLYKQWFIGIYASISHAIFAPDFPLSAAHAAQTVPQAAPYSSLYSTSSPVSNGYPHV